jgi:hypothetical protein
VPRRVPTSGTLQRTLVYERWRRRPSEAARGGPPPEGANVAHGAASLLVANWSGASPDEGRFPVRPSRLTPSGGQRWSS